MRKQIDLEHFQSFKTPIARQIVVGLYTMSKNESFR